MTDSLSIADRAFASCVFQLYIYIYIYLPLSENTWFNVFILDLEGECFKLTVI